MTRSARRAFSADRVAAALLALTDWASALLLLADLAVVAFSVTARSLFNAPVEWSDDVARGLMVGSAFFGAASALKRGENAGVVFLVDKLGARPRRLVDSFAALLILVVSAFLAANSARMGWLTTGQTTGSGLPLELTFYPMAAGAACMTLFAAEHFFRRSIADVVSAAAIGAFVAGLWYAWSAVAPDALPPAGALMLAGFVLCLAGGMPIGFGLALAALIYLWTEGNVPGVIFAQQMARGIDNFVLLAIPFFILVGYLMEANGMSVRLIALLERLVGRMRGGLNVVMVLSMVIFSGISGSKMADVAAVGSVLVPAARRSKQNPGEAVALLAASAVMAEAIPPCINLIILGFVANLSIGGLFMAGLLPAGVMAAALIAVAVLFGRRAALAEAEQLKEDARRLWSGAAVTLGLLVLIFGGFKTGFATATEISAFAAIYALVVGGAVFRELGLRAAFQSFVHAATRSGLVLFIVAAAQSLAFVLTLQQVPHALADMMIRFSQAGGAWTFMLLSILILIVMGSVLEGAAALIIFGPLLVPVASQIGIAPLHFGVVLVVAMGIGLFAPPLGLGLYGACLIGKVPIEDTVRPILGYLGLLFLCLLVIAFVPGISLWLPHLMGY
ncbi:MAG: TRAP transporter large permease subunit [Betaproteobacteria bacterium]|nr:TRAP transporter large permease subunit [Betaproteobacteria bacterium]